jgi:ferredoxin
MKIRIDRALCEGAATCVGIAPAVFALDEEGKAVVKDPTAADGTLLRYAADECPAKAIVIEE